MSDGHRPFQTLSPPPRRGGSARWVLSFAGLGAAALALIVHGVTAPDDGKGKDKPPAPVEVANVAVKTVTVAEHTIGSVVSTATVNVTSQVTGQLLSAEFKEGHLVKKGAVLFRLDPRPFQAALAQAQAALARDEATLEAAQRNQKRYQTLFNQSAISAQQRDEYVAQSGALAGSVAADAAGVQIAKLNLDYASIRSPIDGKTGPILIQPGNLVKAGDTSAMVVLTQIQPIKVSFSLPQSDLPAIQAQMAAGRLVARISAHGANGATGEPGDSHVLTAPVDFIGNAINNATGTIELRASYANADGRLVPGELVDVAVVLRQLSKAMVVPSQAINTGPNGHFVFAIDAKGLPAMVPVEVMYDDGAQAAVNGRLAAGMEVITAGQLRVEPGKPVSVTGGMIEPAAAAPRGVPQAAPGAAPAAAAANGKGQPDARFRGPSGQGTSTSAEP